MSIGSSVLLRPVPDLMNAGSSQERHQASKEEAKYANSFMTSMVWGWGAEMDGWMNRWMIDGSMDRRVAGNRSNSIHMHICAITIIKSLQGVIIFFSQCINSIFYTSPHGCSDFFGTAQSFIMIYIFCDHLVWKPSGVLFHKRTGALFGPDTVANQSQKAQPFLVEAVQNGTLSQCKKVTEENKTAELPGGASPTHTLTHKCRYAAYSMRFTESNPPPHTDTHLHTYTPSPPFVSICCFLALSHTDFLSGDPDQRSYCVTFDFGLRATQRAKGFLSPCHQGKSV